MTYVCELSTERREARIVPDRRSKCSQRNFGPTAVVVVRDVPVVGVVDTNADPSVIDYVVPGNDDAIKSLEILLNYFVEAVAEGAGTAKQEEK